MFIEVDDVTYKKLLEYSGDCDIGTAIYALVVWAQEHRPKAPSTVKTISKYYDTEKYKATADLKRTSAKDPESH